MGLSSTCCYDCGGAASMTLTHFERHLSQMVCSNPIYGRRRYGNKLHVQDLGVLTVPTIKITIF
jgi:hypothetical protein